jgi:predicted  nucleic acid-binding Zn-ribbon protein
MSFMTKQCPNCSKAFVEERETASRCEDCGWFRNVDGKWYPCPEPPKPADPEPPKDAEPPKEPVLPKPTDPPKDRNPPIMAKVRTYWRGLLTVTQTEDEADEIDNE